MVSMGYFEDTVRGRLEDDPEARAYMFGESLRLLLSGEIEDGRLLLRMYIRATTGFTALAHELNKQPESLMRMFSKCGNPQAKNFLAIVEALGRMTSMEVSVTAKYSNEESEEAGSGTAMLVKSGTIVKETSHIGSRANSRRINRGGIHGGRRKIDKASQAKIQKSNKVAM